jgi:formylglycine-generating enzyme required for sulfatase activity
MDQRQTPIFVTETPARTVDLEAYYIDRYPVTNYQYGKFVEDTVHREPALWNEPLWSQPMQPVVFVGWNDARAYAKWAGKSLPTEPQWEKAGRGTDSRWWTMNSSLADVIRGNTILGAHRKLVFSMKG